MSIRLYEEISCGICNTNEYTRAQFICLQQAKCRAYNNTCLQLKYQLYSLLIVLHTFKHVFSLLLLLPLLLLLCFPNCPFCTLSFLPSFCLHTHAPHMLLVSTWYYYTLHPQCTMAQRRTLFLFAKMHGKVFIIQRVRGWEHNAYVFGGIASPQEELIHSTVENARGNTYKTIICKMHATNCMVFDFFATAASANFVVALNTLVCSLYFASFNSHKWMKQGAYIYVLSLAYSLWMCYTDSLLVFFSSSEQYNVRVWVYSYELDSMHYCCHYCCSPLLLILHFFLITLSHVYLKVFSSIHSAPF